jgi:hypothetical protein
VELRRAPTTAPFVRHWRLLWTPWFSLFAGRHEGRRAVWVETRRDVFFLEGWRE